MEVGPDHARKCHSQALPHGQARRVSHVTRAFTSFRRRASMLIRVSRYNKVAGMVTQLVYKINALESSDPFKKEMSRQLTEKLCAPLFFHRGPPSLTPAAFGWASYPTTRTLRHAKRWRHLPFVGVCLAPTPTPLALSLRRLNPHDQTSLARHHGPPSYGRVAHACRPSCRTWTYPFFSCFLPCIACLHRLFV